MNSLIVRNTIVLCVLVLSLSTAVWGQLYTSTLTGVVTDPTGAVIPNAQARLVDEQKGFAFTATSDASGRFLFRNVPPGSYKLTVQAQGFQLQEQAGITVDINQNIAVNVALQVGATSQTVEITAAAPVL